MSIPIRANPLGYDSWFVKVTRAFNNSIGEPGKVRLDYVPGNAPILKVFVNLDVSLTSVENLKAIAGNLVPSGVSVEWYWSDGMPMSYMRAEWIETVLSDNNNAPYLSTGITPNSETSCKIRCMWTDPTYISSHVVNWFLPLPSGNGKNSYSLFSRSSSGGFLIYSYGSQRGVWYDNIVQHRNAWQTIETRKNTLWTNGTLRKTFQLDYFTASGPLYTNQGNAGIPMGRGCNRISELKIWNDNEDLANYIPAFNSLGETGMYDTVSGEFKVSANKTTTAQFTVGLTLQQVRDMKLDIPGSISSLSLSIPCEVYNDSEAWSVIEAAQQKGWTFTFYWTNVIAYLTPRIDAVVGNGNYTIAYDYQKSTLSISINTDVSPVVFMQLQESLVQIVPPGITQTLTWADGMPADYTRLEYLECLGGDGQQYINTELYVTQETRIVSTSEVNPQYPAGRLSFVYGAEGIVNYPVPIGLDHRLEANGTKSFLRCFWNDKVTAVTVDGRKVSVDYSKNGLYINGQLKATVSDAEFRSDYSLSVFSSVLAASWAFYGRIYELSVWESEVLMLSFIPALDPTGAPCMFDTVTRKPFYNSGTGQFAIGMTLDQVISLKLPVAPASPANELTLSVPGEAMYRQDAQNAFKAAVANGWALTIQYRDIETPEFQGYVVADYIEKPTGSYAYINTGLSQRLLGYFDYMNTECNQTSDYRYIWGIWPMQSNGRGSIWVQKSDSEIWLYALLEVNCEINTRHDLVHVLCARRLGDSSSSTYVGLGVDGSWPAYTADWPIPDGITETYRMFAYHSTERLYSARFTDIEHKDIASFIPAIDPDGNPCMFDFVRKQPFYNANGTNKFAFTIGLTQEQAESLVLGDKGSGLTIQVPEGTDLDIMQANNPNVTIKIQTIPATTN